MNFENGRSLSYLAAIEDPERRRQVELLRTPNISIRTGEEQTIAVAYGENTDGGGFGYYAFSQVERPGVNARIIEMKAGVGVNPLDAIAAVVPAAAKQQVLVEFNKIAAQERQAQQQRA